MPVQKSKGDFKVATGVRKITPIYLGRGQGSQQGSPGTMAPLPFLLSQVAKTQMSPRAAVMFPLLLLHLCPVYHNLLFHACYSGLTYPTLGRNLLGNVPCLDPRMAVKTLGLWTVHIRWDLASRSCPKEHPGRGHHHCQCTQLLLPGNHKHTYTPQPRQLKQKRTAMYCCGHRRAARAAVKTAGFSQNH